VVVIGSGPAGSTAALFLARAGVDVTLLEAGTERAALGLTLRVGGITVVNLHRPLRQRADDVTKNDSKIEVWEDIAPGGLTNHWSCAVPRFSPDDFRDAQRAGEAYVWPVGYDDLVPWYEKVEPLLHISGTTEDAPQLPAGRVRHTWKLTSDWARVASHAPGHGRSLVPLPYTYGSDTAVTFSGTVFNSFVRLVRPAMRGLPGKIEPRFDARVLRLEWSGERRRVTAVVFRDAAGREQRLACRAVVVAAGAVNTARLLLESTSADFPEGLGNTEGVLGRYLHDHPLGKLMIDLDTRMSIHPPTYISRPALDRSPPLYAAAGVQWTGTAIRAKSFLAGSPGRLPWIGFNVFGTVVPVRENSVSLDRTRQAADGSAALSLQISRPPEAETTLERTRDEILDLLQKAGVGPRLRLWKVEEQGNAKHFAGTCRMHASPRFGMLDAWSRLHAVPNVMVADSAAFTTGPEKNPVLTAMTLAARGSDRLAADLRSGAI
jgi:choline dehydrogenase-like flavoprotein